jgi:predicted RND superfamily exporter protein
MKQKNKVNTSINAIEVQAVVLRDKLQEQKRDIIRSNPDMIDILKEYIFGDGENPFKEFNASYEEKIEELHNKIEGVAHREKQNYIGKSRKGVNFIKKLKETDIL